MEVSLQIVKPSTLQIVQPPTLELIQPPALHIIQPPTPQPVKHPECNGNRQRLCKYDCPHCYNRSFASSNRAINWSNKNNITPREATISSGKKYWFNCDKCPHDFETGLNYIKKGAWCTYCSNKKLCVNNNCGICFNKSFASSNRVVNWSKKNNITPREVSLNSNKKCWFNCDKCQHDFEAGLHEITRNGWCPYCSSGKLCDKDDCTDCFAKSFASHEKAKYWSKKNKNITPRQVFKKGDGKKYWFNCDKCSHDFDAAPYNVSIGQGCPYCYSKKLCNDNTCVLCFDKSFASCTKAVNWSIKNNITPREVSLNSAKKYWFNCDRCPHDFDMRLHNANTGYWCPYCSSKKLCDNNDCNTCFSKSFASHEKSKCWSSKNDKSPRQVFLNSGSKFIFKCASCPHDFDKSLNKINIGRWCPYCSNPPQKLCTDNDCNHCFNKSFASHEKSKCWSTKNDKLSREVFLNSDKKYWFNCDNCPHDFESKLYHISNGSWCPYCSNPPQKLCTDNECDHCFNNSFASHEKSKHWSKKNNKIQREVFKGGGDKYWFKCDNNHEFESALHSINRGNWCPVCKNKTETKLHEVLSQRYQVVYQPKYDWCVNSETNKRLPFDFEMSDYNIIIELDGDQHFKQVSNWISPEETRQRDIFKMDRANENGYTVIRIYQMDVFKDKNNWWVKLTDAIKNYEIPTRLFISSGDHYDNHM